MSRLEVFFEREFKENQKELLSAKSKLYDIRNDLMITQRENEQLRAKYKREQEKADEYYARATRFRAKLRETEKERDLQERRVEQLESGSGEELHKFKESLEKVETMVAKRAKRSTQLLEKMKKLLSSVLSEALSQKGRARAQEAADLVDKMAQLLNPKNIAGALSPEVSFIGDGPNNKENHSPTSAASDTPGPEPAAAGGFNSS